MCQSENWMLNGMTSQSVFYSNFLVAGLLDWYIFGAIWVRAGGWDIFDLIAAGAPAHYGQNNVPKKKPNLFWSDQNINRKLLKQKFGTRVRSSTQLKKV